MRPGWQCGGCVNSIQTDPGRYLPRVSGVGKLAPAESIAEMRDAEKLIDRISLIEGIPNKQRLGNVGLGESVADQIQVSLEVETESVERISSFNWETYAAPASFFVALFQIPLAACCHS